MEFGDSDRGASARQLVEDLRHQRELFERVFDTAPLMMTIYEPDTKVLRVNRAFERLTGWSSDALTGVSLMERCYPDPEYREGAREYMQACRPEWRDFCVTTRDGGRIESSWTNIRLSDDTQLGIGIDITERKRAEENLRRSEEALWRAHHLKDEFLAILAHELRNPLAPMKHAVDILRGDGASRADTDRVLAILERQLGLMVRLVNDLLDVSRINTGKIDLQRGEVDLVAVVHRAVESSQRLFDVKQQRLVVEPSSGPPVLVDGDPTRLEQVFANLLHNASKFTPARGAIAVGVHRHDEQATVRVCDTGIGITPDTLPRVFDMFVQGDRGVDRAHGGLGIGLSLVKRLVELHGGQVRAFSAGAGQGSEFVVQLPLHVRVAGPTTSAGARGPQIVRPGSTSGQRRTILVVDDNVDAAATLGRLLTAWGHDVVVAHDGRSGVERATTGEIDVVVLDLGMPGMSGYDVARVLRADPRLKGVLLIALTGWDQEEARRESAQAGFDHHLVKPVDLAVLQAIIGRQMGDGVGRPGG